MSHEALERLHENLQRLKLGTAEEVLDATLERAASQNLPAVEVLDHIVAEEVRSRRSSAVTAN